MDIIQIYLKVDEKEEIRVRQRGSDGHYIYYLTRKIRINEHKHLKTERRISENEYLNLIMNADASLGRIRKERYCLAYNNQYFQIDVYPFWKDKALAEIEMYDVSDEVFFPEQIKVIKEVTDDPDYKNASLAKHRPQ